MGTPCCLISKTQALRLTRIDCLQRGDGAALARDAKATEERQKAINTQEEAETAYHAALVAKRAEVALLEGRSMREDIQSKAKAPHVDPRI